MNNVTFISSEVSFKRILKMLGISIVCLITIPTVADYFLTQAFDCNKTNTQENNSQPLVLGSADINLLNKEDEGYYKDADVFINGVWEPSGYIEIQRAIDIPEYDISIGSIVTDSWDIGDDKYEIKCERMTKEYLQNPLYCPLCTLIINDKIISDYVRSDIVCENYDSFFNPENCKLQVGIILYQAESLDKEYLFISSDSVGSIYANFAYQIDKDSYSFLYFDFKDFISDSKLTRGGMELSLYYTDSTKQDVRLIVRFWDPSMQSIEGEYTEWAPINGRWLLDKKVVSIRTD